MLGLLYAHANPDQVAAVVAVAPLIAPLAQQHAQFEYVSAEATRRNDREALERLREIGAPPYRTTETVLAIEAIADRYGAVYHTRPNKIGAMVGGVLRGLVTPWEIPGFIRGNNVSLDAMTDELLQLDLNRSVPSLDVPVFFFLGRYDRHADALIAERYAASLHAPVARVVWFEDSAHNIPFEEPERFTTAVADALQSAGIAGS
jgi:proline iminopeptidase